MDKKTKEQLERLLADLDMLYTKAVDTGAQFDKGETVITERLDGFMVGGLVSIAASANSMKELLKQLQAKFAQRRAKVSNPRSQL